MNRMTFDFSALLPSVEQRSIVSATLARLECEYLATSASDPQVSEVVEWNLPLVHGAAGMAGRNADDIAAVALDVDSGTESARARREAAVRAAEIDVEAPTAGPDPGTPGDGPVCFLERGPGGIPQTSVRRTVGTESRPMWRAQEAA